MKNITIEMILRNFSSILFVCLIVVSVADKMIKKTLQDDQV